MSDFKFNPKVDYTNELIEECINNNDLVGLRDVVGSICYTCRDFSDGEFYRAIHYVEITRGIKIKEKFNPEPALISKTKPKEEFTLEDFGNAVFDLKNNFCDERIEDVKFIGKSMYGNKSKSSNNNNSSSLSLLKDISSYINTISKSESSIIKEIQSLKKNSDIDMKNVTKAVTYIEKQYNLVYPKTLGYTKRTFADLTSICYHYSENTLPDAR